jgi:pimeloyl-ACP methyl ester carboxylesterase
VLRRFDVVGFDPRGVGASTPVECIPADLKDQVVAAEPRPTTPEQVDEAFALQQELAEAAPRSTARRWAPSTPSTPPATWTCCASRWATSS